MADEFRLVHEVREAGDARPQRRKGPAAKAPAVAAFGSLRLHVDPLLGDCVAAFGAERKGRQAPFIARVTGVGQPGGPRYLLQFVGGWMSCGAMGGTGAAAGFNGASVTAVSELRDLECLDIRSGAGDQQVRGYYLWVASLRALEPMTELELRLALASPYRKGPADGRRMLALAQEEDE